MGAIDGKHILMQKPHNAGSDYHNYKGTESIVLMAVCDSEYKFTVCDIGQPGRQSDGGIWEDSTFGRALQHGGINLPEDRNLPGGSDPMPFVFVGDEAFPLKPYLMRPWPGRMLTDETRKIYNYRLSRARRVIENTFGILSARWRLLHTKMIADNEKAVSLVRAMCVLHNFLRTTVDLSYAPPGYCDTLQADGNVQEGFWRGSQIATLGMDGHASRSSTAKAAEIRNAFTNYFSSERGSVPWQLNHVRAI